MNGWEDAAYGWAKNIISWDGIYFWWWCCEECCNYKNFDYYINLVDKAVQSLREWTLILKKKFSFGWNAIKH